MIYIVLNIRFCRNFAFTYINYLLEECRYLCEYGVESRTLSKDGDALLPWSSEGLQDTKLFVSAAASRSNSAASCSESTEFLCVNLVSMNGFSFKTDLLTLNPLHPHQHFPIQQNTSQFLQNLIFRRLNNHVPDRARAHFHSALVNRIHPPTRKTPHRPTHLALTRPNLTVA